MQHVVAIYTSFVGYLSLDPWCQLESWPQRRNISLVATILSLLFQT